MREKLGKGLIFRACDQAVLALFKEISVIDDIGTSQMVPTLHADDERLNSHFMKPSVKSPVINLIRTGILLNPWRLEYTINLRTTLYDYMNQMLEQVVLLFNPTADLKIGNFKAHLDEIYVPPGDRFGLNVYVLKISVKLEGLE